MYIKEYKEKKGGGGEEQFKQKKKGENEILFEDSLGRRKRETSV